MISCELPSAPLNVDGARACGGWADRWAGVEGAVVASLGLRALSSTKTILSEQ